MPAEAREDPLFIRTKGKELGRDGCRVPIPWTTDPTTNFGFSPVAMQAVAAATGGLGRAFGRARGGRPQLDAGLVPNVAWPTAGCCRVI